MVYCFDCVHLILVGHGKENLYDECHTPQNMERENNWKGEWRTKEHPRKINKRNDCKWFQGKDKDD